MGVSPREDDASRLAIGRPRAAGIVLACSLAIGGLLALDCTVQSEVGETVTPVPLADVLAEVRGRPGPQPDRYNLIVFVSDALRASNLSFYGYRRQTTPNLDAFGRYGIRFDQHHANYPATALSVSQFHSGRVRPPLLIGNAPLRYPTKAIAPDLLVLPRVLQQAGYATSIATSHPWFDDDARLLQWFEDQHLVAPAEGAAYATAEGVLAGARTFLASAASQTSPFFQYIHVMDTHQPNQVRPGFASDDIPQWIPDGYTEYDSEIAYMDHWFGELMRLLAETDRLTDTIVVFTADHGEEFGEQGPGAWNQAHGWTLRRPLLHVPLIVWLPQDPEPGRVVNTLTRHVDMAPTLVKLVDPSIEPGAVRIDGTDLSPTLLTSGTEPSGVPDSLSFSARYWGLHSKVEEAHHDNWHGNDVAFAVETNRWNYEDGVALVADSSGESLIARLEQQRLEHQRAWEEVPPRTDPVGRAQLAFAGAVDTAVDQPPTYTDSNVDHRWAQLGGYRLTCHPSENCGGLSMSFPWIPGRYRLSLLFDPSKLEDFRNVVTVVVDNDVASPIRLEGEAQSMPLGEFELGDPFSIRILDPSGGVALTGLELVPAGTEAGAPGASEGGPVMDPHQLEQLRALGYVD